MRRIVALTAVAVLVSGLAVLPASADIDSNPNVVMFGPAQCDNGLEFGMVWSPSNNAVVGQDPDSNLVGVAKTIWFVDEDGNKVTLLTKPLSPGLAKLTSFCWWPAPLSPTGFVGGDILFSGQAR